LPSPPADKSIRRARGSAKPAFEVKYEIRRRQELVEEAGYSLQKRSRPPFVIGARRHGQMLSLPMNEFIQQSLKEIGIDIESGGRA